jgi:hypothetical protein
MEHPHTSQANAFCHDNQQAAASNIIFFIVEDIDV